jgi:beta-glucanase (GH16 family)
LGGAAVALSACGDSDPPTDDDAGEVHLDGATRDATLGQDSGTSPRDAGAGTDNGTAPPPRVDAGSDPVDVRGKDVGGAIDTGTAPDATTTRDAGTGTKDATTTLDVAIKPDGKNAPDVGSPMDATWPTDAGPSGDASRPGWTLIFSDEFNAASGTGVDTTKWNLVNKGDGFGNNELEFYTNRTNNAYQDGNGFLVIKVIKESYMGREYTSARLESNGKFEHTYGRYEARLQLPRGQGIWPAFWMLGNDIGSAGWPNCGEIDIMENIGKEPSIVHGSLHGPGYSGGNPLGQAYTLPGGAKFADGFHTFAVEWEQSAIRFYVDDMLYGTKTPSDTPNGAKWVYDHPFYLLLNVAVGGTWPGSPDSTTTFPQTMLVDYVRVYTKQ